MPCAPRDEERGVHARDEQQQERVEVEREDEVFDVEAARAPVEYLQRERVERNHHDHERLCLPLGGDVEARAVLVISNVSGTEFGVNHVAREALVGEHVEVDVERRRQSVEVDVGMREEEDDVAEDEQLERLQVRFATAFEILDGELSGACDERRKAAKEIRLDAR